MSVTSTTISQRENTSRALDLLAAQRRIYSLAKAIQVWHTLASVPVVIMLSLVSTWSPDLKPFAAGWGFLLVVIDTFVLTPRQTKLKEKGAKIQEMFDCEVLQLPWRSLKCDPRPSEEAVIRNAAAFKRKHLHKPDAVRSLHTWYAHVVDDLPLHMGRLVCQRINCWWDGTLRREYANTTLITSIVVVTLLVGAALLAGSTTAELVLSLVALSPLISWGFRQFRDNAGASDRLEKLRNHASTLWQDALENRKNASELNLSSRDLQDEIYDMRRRNPLIFDWVYGLSKIRREADMNKIAEELVQTAKSISSSP